MYEIKSCHWKIRKTVLFKYEGWIQISIFIYLRTPTPSNDPNMPILNPWSQEMPNFIRFGYNGQTTSVDMDYRKTYSTKPFAP